MAALEAGGVDYVTKPIKPKEVLARMNVHLQGARRARQDARQAGQARNALDAFGYASITVRLPEGRLIWQTALARDLLQRYCDTARARDAARRARMAAQPPPDARAARHRAAGAVDRAGREQPHAAAAPADRAATTTATSG